MVPLLGVGFLVHLIASKIVFVCYRQATCRLFVVVCGPRPVGRLALTDKRLWLSRGEAFNNKISLSADLENVY